VRFTSRKRAVKSTLTIALLACALQAQAQHTFQFNATLTGGNEVPPNSDPTVCTGIFWLTGNSLSFVVNVPAVTFISLSAYIQGPAFPGSDAPVLFDLGGSIFHGGNDFGSDPYYAYFSPAWGPFGAGPFTLTEAQINELEGGLWYLNITSYIQPCGQLRGQILEVREATLSGSVVTNNVFQFTVSEVRGLNYVIQASTNLASTNWISIATNTAPFTVIDTAFTNTPRRFYRALYKP
jgi:hypothetical protein